MAAATYSLRRRLLALLTLVSGLLWLGAAASSYLRAHGEADQIFDAQLAELAQALMAVADASQVPSQPLVMPAPTHRYQQKILFQIWGWEGDRWVLLMRSSNAPLEPVTAADGFSEREWGGGLWRFYGETDRIPGPGPILHKIQVAQSHEVRDELARDVALRLMAPLLLALPLLALALWFVVGAAVGPLSALADQVRGRHPRRLDPLAVEGPLPAEAAPLVAAINDLFLRVATVLENERNFTADAAHELRTPLAALKVQAQVAARAEDPEQRCQALARVETGVARMTHLVEQLLTLARLDPQGPDAAAPHEDVDLAILAAETAALAMPQALARGQVLEVDAAASRPVKGNPALLRTLLRNLLENAMRYTPEGGRIEIAVGDGRLWVRDGGPGIAPGHRVRVLDRFYRHAETQEAGAAGVGAGLGLSIVARIAQLHGARLHLGEGDSRIGLGGLEVQVDFPGGEISPGL